jgi:hypothetical protein
MSKMVDIVARAIKDETDKFDSPARLYLQPEAGHRWEKANPGKDYYLDGPNHDALESYRIIAHAAIKALHKALCEGDYFWMECQECAAGRRLDSLVKSFPEESALNKSPPPQQ